MQKFKLEIYKKENQRSILEYETLNLDESNSIFLKIKNIVKCISKDLDDEVIFKSAEKKLFQCIDVKDEIDQDLIAHIFLDIIKLPLDSKVYIFWDINSFIDQFNIEKLIENWEYIWYDTSDEAILIYIEFKSILMLITDHGFIKLNYAISQSISYSRA